MQTDVLADVALQLSPRKLRDQHFIFKRSNCRVSTSSESESSLPEILVIKGGVARVGKEKVEYIVNLLS